MTNAERAEQLQTLAAMARQDGQERAAETIELAAKDAAQANLDRARGRINALVLAGFTSSMFWDAYDYAKLAAEVLS